MRVTAHIDLAALVHNFGIVKQRAPKAQVMAMVKANAYGHGLLHCATALPDVDYFGVATLAEAQTLRTAGLQQPIVLMSGFQSSSDLDVLQTWDLDTIVYDERQVDLLARYHGDKKIRVWLKMDTGMHRFGCAPTQAESLLRRLEALAQVEIVAVMSHLACADVKEDPHTLQQLETFEKITKDWSYPRSILNSAGILYHPDFQYNIVRPGLLLYGASPTLALRPADIGLQPVMELSAQVLALIPVKKRDGVGYGQQWRAERDSLIATVSAGYGDGYPQQPKAAIVLIQDQACPLVGRVSMDFMGADVTDLPQVKLGDSVLLWGKSLPANEIAQRLGVSVYPLLTGVMERVARKSASAGLSQVLTF